MELVRKSIYGDIELRPLEIQVIDRPVFQRLVGLSQLGLTTKVYPSAHRTKLDHSIGTLYIASRILRNLKNKEINSISSKQEQAVRFAALLHDLSYPPFGDALEEKGGVVSSGERRLEQFISEDQGEGSIADILKQAEVYNATMWVLTGKEDYRKRSREKELIDPEPYMREIVGGPISADLLDRINRGSFLTGVPNDFQELIYRSFGIDERGRLGIKLYENGEFFSDRLTALVSLLESVLTLSRRLHHNNSKLKLDALLITAVSFAKREEGLKDEDIYGLTDFQLLDKLSNSCGDIASRLVDKVRKRELYRPVDILTYDNFSDLSEETKCKVRKLLFEDWGKRWGLERSLERAVEFPSGSIITGCPKRRKQLTEAEVRVIWKSESIGLNEIPRDKISEKVEALRESYEDVWKVYLLVSPKFATREAEIPVKREWRNKLDLSHDFRISHEGLAVGSWISKPLPYSGGQRMPVHTEAIRLPFLNKQFGAEKPKITVGAYLLVLREEGRTLIDEPRLLSWEDQYETSHDHNFSQLTWRAAEEHLLRYHIPHGKPVELSQGQRRDLNIIFQPIDGPNRFLFSFPHLPARWEKGNYQLVLAISVEQELVPLVVQVGWQDGEIDLNVIGSRNLVMEEDSLASYLEKALETYRMSASQLSEESGLSLGYINRLLKGSYETPPSQEELDSFVEAFAADEATRDELYVAAGYWPPSVPRSSKATELLLRSSRIARYSQLSEGAEKVYNFFQEESDEEGECKVSQKQLADEFGVSRSSIQRYVNELKNKRLVEHKRNGRNASTYRVVDVVDPLPHRLPLHDLLLHDGGSIRGDVDTEPGQTIPLKELTEIFDRSYGTLRTWLSTKSLSDYSFKEGKANKFSKRRLEAFVSRELETSDRYSSYEAQKIYDRIAERFGGEARQVKGNLFEKDKNLPPTEKLEILGEQLGEAGLYRLIEETCTDQQSKYITEYMKGTSHKRIAEKEGLATATVSHHIANGARQVWKAARRELM